MFAASITGLYNATALLERGVERVNRDEIVEGYVDMMEAERLAKANIAAIRTADRLLGSLLDIYA